MSVDYTIAPTGADLLASLQTTGIVKNPPTGAAALIDYAAKMAAAVTEWDRLTGYKPFLVASDAVATTTTYSAREIRRGVLKLRGGLVSLSSISVDGAAQVADTDYEGVAGLSPLKKLRFLGDVSGSITVTGIVGYGYEYPPDVWEALIDRGRFRCFPELALTISGGRTDIRADDVSLSFVRSSGNRASSGGPLSGEAEIWKANWIAKIQEYRL